MAPQRRRIVSALPAALGALLVVACSLGPSPVVAPPELRVGIAPDAPPMVSRRGEEFAGLEVDLAHRLGRELGRPVRFVPMAFSDQIPALLAGGRTWSCRG
jgi:polar amino acid transport system substrate-binding protein